MMVASLLRSLALVCVVTGSAVASPVAFWSFEEGTAGNHPAGTAGAILDSSGIGNHGTALNTGYLTYSSDVPVVGNPNVLGWNSGDTLSLDFGSTDANQTVRVPNSSTFDVSSGLTIEGWINPSTTTPTSQLALQKWEGTGQRSYILRLNFNNKLEMVVGQSSPVDRVSGSTAIPANQWTHVAGVWNQATQRLEVYVNGKLDNAVTFTGAVPNSSAADVYLGWGSSNGVPFQGLMDDVRISNTALRSDQFLMPSVVGYWRFEEGTPGAHPGSAAGSVLDSSFYGNNGRNAAGDLASLTYSSDVKGWRVDPTGESNAASLGWASTGGSAYLAVDDSDSLDLATAITIEAFVNPSSLSGYQGIVSKWDGTTDRSYILRLNGDKLQLILRGAGDATQGVVTSQQSIPLDTWTHVAATWSADDNLMRLYLDGVLDGNTSTFASTIQVGGGALRLGDQGGFTFNGLLDDVRISRVALEPYQFLTLVPEPSSASLLGLGLLGLAALGRRRK